MFSNVKQICKNKYVKGIPESSLHKAQKQSTSFNERQSLTELTVILAVAGEWVKPTRQPRGLIPIRRNLSTKDRNSGLRHPRTFRVYRILACIHFPPYAVFSFAPWIRSSLLTSPFNLSVSISLNPTLVSRSVPRV